MEAEREAGSFQVGTHAAMIAGVPIETVLHHLETVRHDRGVDVKNDRYLWGDR